MLKALEIIGFKSFADKTRFEFPPGITVVVGPNGSGKSNVVDAIKWVLGEQSVKSLRGKEMADVIFNGSGSRRPMNSAEITVTFDNEKKLLPIDTAEVHITRRLYRSGESEYLINRIPSRLRDIRELLSGTGMGTQAYSVIEQGKVDVLLQSSPKDRRLIFEEAAGISLFKAKKLEAIRRLERVEQNLLRLSDIVDEVDSQLRSIRSQAGKARRYKECADQLRELRVEAGLVDWHRLSEKLEYFQTQFNELSEERAVLGEKLETVEKRMIELDERVNRINESIRDSQGRSAANREQIASHEATFEHERKRIEDYQQETARHQQKLVRMNARVGDLQTQLAQTATEIKAADAGHRQSAAHLAVSEARLSQLTTQLEEIRCTRRQQESELAEQRETIAAEERQIDATKSRIDTAEATQLRHQERLEDLKRKLIELDTQLRELTGRNQVLETQKRLNEGRLEKARHRIDITRKNLSDAREELARVREQCTGTGQRIAVLEDLEQRHEGLSTGVREILAQARTSRDGPLRQVIAMVADLFQVSVETAPIIEAALGSAAQQIVLSPGDAILKYLKNESTRLTGRVGFVRMDLLADEESQNQNSPGLSLQSYRGVIGRADQFIETESDFRALAYHLLGRTWVVERLEHALTISTRREVAGAHVRFVTLAGELLEADGTVWVGPTHAGGGIISRRSELRELRTQVDVFKARIEKEKQEVAALTEELENAEEEYATLKSEHRESVAKQNNHQHEMTTVEERQNQIQRQHDDRLAELEEVETRLAEETDHHDQHKEKLHELLKQLDEKEFEIEQTAEQITTIDQQQQQCGRETTEAKVALAKSEERLENLKSRLRQFEESRAERDRVLREHRETLARLAERIEQAERTMLRTTSIVAELYLRKESLADETARLVEERALLGTERTKLTSDIQKVNTTIRKLEAKIHQSELGAGDIRHERGAMADRIREDYKLELAELAHEHQLTEEEVDRRDEVEKQINDFRQRIALLGNVNLDALERLEELDERYQTLSGQFEDLTKAKNELLRIVDRINEDSRRLFFETLEVVRGHFQQLFRDLFGGGQADIVLEDEENALESGIEIVARPPGKEPRNISLLSGGEKTMTCVALLLAIFRSRPSPFCVLDEVDAALDEANIGRFTNVLREFLRWTQFIIVSHSKKTMTCANSIYGVTMQESGISKQVSVRFEDVSEDGHIHPSALKNKAA